MRRLQSDEKLHISESWKKRVSYSIYNISHDTCKREKDISLNGGRGSILFPLYTLAGGLIIGSPCRRRRRRLRHHLSLLGLLGKRDVGIHKRIHLVQPHSIGESRTHLCPFLLTKKSLRNFVVLGN